MGKFLLINDFLLLRKSALQEIHRHRKEIIFNTPIFVFIKERYGDIFSHSHNSFFLY